MRNRQIKRNLSSHYKFKFCKSRSKWSIDDNSDGTTKQYLLVHISFATVQPIKWKILSLLSVQPVTDFTICHIAVNSTFHTLIFNKTYFRYLLKKKVWLPFKMYVLKRHYSNLILHFYKVGTHRGDQKRNSYIWTNGGHVIWTSSL